ncbi:MAG: hypothetical protein KJN92_06930, partial [Gemmatimonadetes bacterium]|nr:hypothetical protein [Gemmatimonadota bacterium]
LGAAGAQVTQSPSPLSDMPVREVTVFKDGHAFVLHSGTVPVNRDGDVILDYLPRPVIGTFWPFSSDNRARLTSVVADRHRVSVDRTAITLRELMEANVGRAVIIREQGPSGVMEYPATILDVPAQSADEQETLDPTGPGGRVEVKGNIVLLQTASEVKVVAIERILGLGFPDNYDGLLPRGEFRGMLTLNLDWGGGTGRDADVGLLYLQRGIRWIPNYKVEIDGDGRAVVRLQATLVNELADLDDVTTHLVIGVPRFVFQDTPDPMALQETAAELSQYFRQGSQTAQGFSNALMTQVGFAYEAEGLRQDMAPAGPGGETGPEVVGSAENEDLFVFTVEHVTLKKGQRMVLPVAEYEMDYRDVFALSIPFTPPPEVWRNFNAGRQSEMAQILGAPKVMHKIRLTNDGDHPLTTAPALILANDRLLAQGMMRYAAPGAEVDLEITNAVDIQVKKKDNETGRVPNATVWQGDQYGRVDLGGTITLTSYRDEPLTVEVVRHVLGNVVSAARDGEIEMVNLFEDPSFSQGAGPFPTWWGWFSWPWWWHHFNSVGRITWTVDLEPSEPMELAYTWNYFWR